MYYICLDPNCGYSSESMDEIVAHIDSTHPEIKEMLDRIESLLGDEDDGLCHCGRPVTFGFDGDPSHHRGMCADCDAVRCDAYLQECPYQPQKEGGSA